MSDPRASRRSGGFTPAGLPSLEPGRQRPPRPLAVELAAATVIITGIVSILQSVEVVATLAQTGADDLTLAALSLGIGVATVVIGVLLRVGRAWLIGVNLLAIAGFLELISGSAVGILFGLLDVLVVAVLVAHRSWFSWSADASGDATPGP